MSDKIQGSDELASVIYKVITYDGEFISFWKQNENTVSFFRPNHWNEKYFSKSLSEWNTAREHYASRQDDLASYDEIINSAWHFLGQQAAPIDKSKVTQSIIRPGVFYPRIWRGYYADNPMLNYTAVNPSKEYGHKHFQSIVATSSLFDYLSEIFRHIEPAKENLQTFSHKIRELLILACTEIESGWRAILEENTSSENHKSIYTTNDYFKVKEPLRLGAWGIVLKNYPNLGMFTPFEKWDGASPTKSLDWYGAYNAVKHNREIEFSKATLGSLLNAVAALHIMQLAQWGPEIYSFLHDNRSSLFEMVKCPTFAANEIYMPSIDESHSLTAGLYFENKT